MAVQEKFKMEEVACKGLDIHYRKGGGRLEIGGGLLKISRARGGVYENIREYERGLGKKHPL